MLGADRRREVYDIVRRRRSATVAELAGALAVSVQTVRRDLDVLGEQGLIERVHGGAVVADGPPAGVDEGAAPERSFVHADENRRWADLRRHPRLREDRHEWGPRMNAQELHLRSLVAAGLEVADCTGFTVADVESRMEELAEAVMGYLLWQRDTEPLSGQERERVERIGGSTDPSSVDYLCEWAGRLFRSMRPVEALAIRFEAAYPQLGEAGRVEPEPWGDPKPAPALPGLTYCAAPSTLKPQRRR